MLPDRPRRCLILSYVFAPSIGGIETVSRTLAESLTKRGYDVRVLTLSTASRRSTEEPAALYEIVRRPNLLELLRQLRWCDVVLQSNFSLALAWPLALLAYPRPWMIVHHTPLARPSGKLTVRDQLKRWLVGRAHCYAVSGYLASIVPAPCKVLFNPYNESTFRRIRNLSRDRSLIFAGRLVTAKGLDVLLHALAVLKARSIVPTLTVVGDGPEKSNLQHLVSSLELSGQVSFVGARSGAELARLMNQHQILVVPSRAEPPECLPMICLEGIACGCVVLAADQGGLPEAIGPCGATFQSGSAPHLAQKIRELLESSDRRAQMDSQADAFLRSFARETVLDQYEAAIARAVESARMRVKPEHEPAHLRDATSAVAKGR